MKRSNLTVQQIFFSVFLRVLHFINVLNVQKDQFTYAFLLHSTLFDSCPALENLSRKLKLPAASYTDKQSATRCLDMPCKSALMRVKWCYLSASFFWKWRDSMARQRVRVIYDPLLLIFIERLRRAAVCNP